MSAYLETSRAWYVRVPVVLREAILAALICLLGALAVTLLLPQPDDASAHLYRALLVERDAVLWDNFWYSGDYPLVSYSLLVYLPQQLIGPATLALIDRIDVRPAEDLDALGPTGRHTVRLRLTGRDGARHEIRQSHAKGNAADPLDRAEVLAKYAALAGPVLGADGAEALRAAVLDLDRMPEVGRLSGLLVRR